MPEVWENWHTHRKVLNTHRARHIVLLSRSRSKPKYNQDLAEISKMGCRVDMLRCDVTSIQDFRTIKDGLLAGGKVISGVGHSTRRQHL